MSGLLGKKIGMTQIFDSSGKIVPVTAVEAGPCFVLETKAAPLPRIKLGFSQIKETRLSKAELGYFKKINVSPLKFVREIPLKENAEFKIGQEIKADIFTAGDFVDVTGVSIGKGFQGGMKRWHWHGGPMTHGSTSRRRAGSIGSSTTPGRTIKGHHMPGHMGADKVTVQNIRVIKVDKDNNLLLLKGAVPGSRNSFLVIKKAKKKTFKPLTVETPKPDSKEKTEKPKEAHKEKSKEKK